MRWPKEHGLLPRFEHLENSYIKRGEVRLSGLDSIEEFIKNTPAEATLPERLVYAWLTMMKRIFTFQAPAMGGRDMGGAVLDFLVQDVTPNIAIRVQGDYWHGAPAKVEEDYQQEVALRAFGYEVIDVWESEIKTLRELDDVMTRRLYGIRGPQEMGPI